MTRRAWMWVVGVASLLSAPSTRAQVVSARAPSAPVPVAQAPAVLGEWRGRSTCLVRPSPCNDEVVVYDIRRDSVYGDSLAWQADKIVNGVRDPMGVLRCAWHSPVLACKLRVADWWRLTLHGDTLSGFLDLGDGRRFREVVVTRAPKP